MKITVSLLIVLFCGIIPLKAQFVSFDIADMDSGKMPKQIEPLLQSISLSSSRHFFSLININNRLGIGFAYSQGFTLSGEKYSSDRTGGYPNFYGSLLVTQNLLLKGNISLFKSGDETVQSFAYGFGLNITERENYNWRASVLFAQLQDPDDMKNRSVDLAIINDFSIGKFPLFIGIGLNSYKTKFLFDVENSTTKSLKGNAHHILFGGRVNKGNFIFIPVFQVNSSIAIFSIEIINSLK